MSRSAIFELPLDVIVVGERLRPVNAAIVDALAEVIAQDRFKGAILVRPMPGNPRLRKYELVAGAHRLAAMRRLGRTKIPCDVQELSDDEALKAEIDENLIRGTLTPLERGEAIVARARLYAKLYPERMTEDGYAKRGRPTNSAKISELVGAAPSMGFAESVAEEIGLTDRHIRNALAVGRIPPETRARLHGTPIAKNEGLLRQLASMGDKAEQAKVAELLIEGKAKSVPEGMAIAAGNTPMKAVQTPVDDTVKAFRELWGKASPSGREAILNDLAGRKLPKGWAVTEVADG